MQITDTFHFILALFLAVGIFVYLVMGWPFFRFITYAGTKRKKESSEKEKKPSDPNRRKWFALKQTVINHPRNGFEEEYEAGKAWCKAQPMQDWYIRSTDGLKLHASWYPAARARRIVLMSHGYRGTRFGSVAHIARFLHENNTSLLMIDQRCCGLSEGSYITFGAKEQEDVLAWLESLSGKNTQKLPVYLYGQSMGAAAVILAAGHPLPSEVRGVIADCGFHSMKQQLRDIASSWFHLHRIELLLLRVDLFCHIFGHFRMKDTDTTQALKQNRLPVLFFHGEDDTYVFPENSRLNYELCTAPKELVMIPRARHLCCSYAAPELYRQKVSGFFEKYDCDTGKTLEGSSLR